jgi:hypothetical protein
MEYSVYTDFSRPLTSEERSIIFEALEVNVPDSGCVGIQNGPSDEMYFRVEASTDAEAQAQAIQYAGIILRAAKLNVAYTISLQICRSGEVIHWQVPNMRFNPDGFAAG